ncbi:hypothetical protein DCAR_0103769 [Daucus carota subsp. sativus]|uniref:Uncharacterized protein n=1 Tax=Daucus carota subsp. sativus TaxID=79200 RepID=A0A166I9T6_DAUCS|nr:hypothetical protein DCAR_0103769 [Daucus carota subsp. sativus]
MFTMTVEVSSVNRTASTEPRHLRKDIPVRTISTRSHTSKDITNYRGKKFRKKRYIEKGLSVLTKKKKVYQKAA